MNNEWELEAPPQKQDYDSGSVVLEDVPLRSSVGLNPICQVMIRDGPIRVVFSNNEFSYISGWSLESLNSQITDKGLFFIQSCGHDSFGTLIMDALVNQIDSPRTRGQLVRSDGNKSGISFTVRPLKFKDDYAAMVGIWMVDADYEGKTI